MSTLEPKPDFAEAMLPEADAPAGSPLHGFQGDRAVRPESPVVPASLTVTISREAGSRGTSIGRRAARKLGWQIYNQELLEYIAQEGPFRQDLADRLPQPAARWAGDRLAYLQREYQLDQNPSLVDLARIMLALAVDGNVVLIGRGAGCMLPAESTLNVRILAPLDDRIAYMSQWLRLTRSEAEDLVRLRDGRRADFLAMHFRRQAGDIWQYDLLLNSSLLGEEACAELIAQAARSKLAARGPGTPSPAA
jgi:cytidylate kinase